MEIDQICQLLNQLELNLNERKPFVSQILGIISFCDRAEKLTPPGNSNHRVENFVDEHLEPLCDNVEGRNISGEEPKIVYVTLCNNLSMGSQQQVYIGEHETGPESKIKSEYLNIYQSVEPDGSIHTRDVCADEKKASDDLNLLLPEELDGVFQKRYSPSSVQYCPVGTHPSFHKLSEALKVETDSLTFGFLPVTFTVAWSSAKSQILLDYYLYFLQQCFLIALVIFWIVCETNDLMALIVLWYSHVIPCINLEVAEYGPSRKATQLVVLSNSDGCYGLSFYHTLMVYYLLTISNCTGVLRRYVGYNSLQAEEVQDSGDLFLGQAPSYDLSLTCGLYLKNGIDFKTCKQIRLDFYLFSSEWKGLGFSLRKKYVIIGIITMIGEVDLGSYLFGCTLSICHNKDGITSWFLKCWRCVCLGLIPRVGCVLKEGHRDFQYLAVGETITNRQIKLDEYLFTREWMSFSTLNLKASNSGGANTLYGELVLWIHCPRNYLSFCNMMDDYLLLPVIVLNFKLPVLFCGVHKLRSSSQNQKNGLNSLYNSKDFYKTLFITVVDSRQIELDFYWFSRVWNGLTYLSFMEYDRSLWFKHFPLNYLTFLSSLDVLSQLSPSGAWDVNTYEWGSRNMKPLFEYKWLGWKFQQFGFSFRQGLKVFFTMFFFSHQYTSWNSWDVMWDPDSHPCRAYLDIRPLSQYTPSARVWAVSTYIWLRWDSLFFDVHKLNDVLLFGGNWSSLNFVSHLPPYGRKDATLYVTRGSFMRIKRQHIRVLKEVPVAVHCNHGRSGADEDLVDISVSFSVLDRMRISTSLLGSIYSCLDTYLYFLFNALTLCYVAKLCYGSVSSSVSTDCDG